MLKGTNMAGLVRIVIIVSLLAVAVSQDDDQLLVTSKGCGDTKGCFKEPADCEMEHSNSDCDVLITWEPASNGGNESTIFGISGNVESGEAYVAMGLSYDTAMHNTDVWACLQLDTSDVVLDHSYNNFYSNIQGDTTGASEYSFKTIDGAIQCQFTRVNKIEGSEDRFFDLYESVYYLLIARGPRQTVGSLAAKLGKHTRPPLVSNEAVNFTAVSSTGGGSTSLSLQKAHGSLMVFGWIGCASIAIVMARYFKPIWPDSKLLGEKVWFTIHRTLMIINLLCFCTAFIIIFVHVGGWIIYETTSDLRFVHAVIGCIVVALGITNPILAMFRPHPGTPKRPIFNWAHWAIGTSAHLLAVVNIFLGMDIFSLPNYSLWVLLSWFGFHFVFEIVMEVLNCVYKESETFTSLKLYRMATGKTNDETMAINSVHNPSADSKVEAVAMSQTNAAYQGDINVDVKSQTTLDQPIISPATNTKLVLLGVYVVVTVGIMTYLIVEVCLV